MRGNFFIVALILGASAGVSPAEASVTTLRGTVIQRAGDAHSFVLATKTGRMVGIGARRSPRAGRIARVSARPLGTGRYSARVVRIFGRRNQARIRGTVPFVNRARTVFRVRTRGAAVLVHFPTATKAGRQTRWVPRRGSSVDIRVEIARDGRLKFASRYQSATPSGGRTPGINKPGVSSPSAPDTEKRPADATEEQPARQGKLMFVDGVVVALDSKKRTLTVSPEQEETQEDAEPAEEEAYAQPVTIAVPRAYNFSRFSRGQVVGLIVRKQPSGTLVLEDSAIGGDDDDSHDPQNTSTEE